MLLIREIRIKIDFEIHLDYQENNQPKEIILKEIGTNTEPDNNSFNRRRVTIQSMGF